MNFIFALLILSLAAAIIEYLFHAQALKSVPIRIHINGSRGKSSVTRLIAAGLRGGGKRVIAKTTGSAPMIIYEDGTEEPIPRRGKPNIKELVHFFRIVKKRNVDAAVVECMAILPELQKVTEKSIVKSTIGVITNVRPDHMGEMGNSLKEIAVSLSSTIPGNAVFFSSENRFETLFKKKSEELHTQFNPISLSPPTEEEMNAFPYIEHKENVELALNVCKFIGISRDIALKGMHTVEPDIGVLRIHRISEYGKEIEFINAFAANDPESIYVIWERIKKRSENKIVLINTRRDRVMRSKQLGELVARKMNASHYIVTGSFVKAFIRSAVKAGLGRNKILNYEGKSVERIYQKIIELSEEKTLLFATGNFVNFGWEITKFFTQKAEEVAYNVQV